MKIIRDDKLYIQKSDVAYLDMSDVAIPSFVYHKLYGNGSKIVGEFNELEFEEYSDKAVADFFKSLSWILDYDEVKDLTDEEIDSLGEELIDQRNSIASMYNGMSQEEREKNQSLPTQCELLEYKVRMLREFYLYKNGKSKMQLPKEIVPEVKKSKGIKQLVKSIYNKFKK